MDEEFATSPSKRRRTMSPEEEQGKLTSSVPVTASIADPTTDSIPPTEDAPAATSPVRKDENVTSAGFLDILMQQAQAESSSGPIDAATVPDSFNSQQADAVPQAMETDAVPQMNRLDTGSQLKSLVENGDPAHPSTTVDGSVTATPPQLEQNATMTTSEDATQEPREWETDSSPLESSDSDDSEDSDEDEGGYSLLDPEEQARILMQDDGGSDDEGNKGKEKATTTVRTANERVEEVIPKPNIEVTADMKVEVLGTADAIVESTVVVKAKTSGEYQVLESGSLLCLGDRSVVGVVAETMGRVEQPMYTIRFTNDAAIEEAGLSTAGTMVYYVVPHSTFVFTQPLQGLKGSDASNFHDEEVGDDEMEFSDDEKEAEHKRQLKLKKQGRLGRDDGARGGRGGRGRGRGRGEYSGSNLRHSSVVSQPESLDTSNGTLNYDDDPEDGYTPLRRPSTDQPPLPPSTMSPPMNGTRGQHHSRGRANFRGNRGRGNLDQFNRPSFHSNQQQYQRNQNHSQQVPPPPPAFTNPPSFYSQAQQTPQLNPQATFGSFSPSPISPLPAQQFNFGQYQNFGTPPSAPGQAPGTMPQPQQHNQQQQFNPFMHNAPQHQNQNSNPTPGMDWTWPPPNLNQDAIQQVQRHLAELNRLRSQGPQQ